MLGCHSAAEWNFWMSDDVASSCPRPTKLRARGETKSQQIKEKLRTIKPGDDIVTGVRAIDTAGHTPGHISIEVASGRDGMIVLGECADTPHDFLRAPSMMPGG